MFGFVSRFFRFGRFGRNESGALAPVLAVAAIPIVMAAGFAVDYGNAVSVQARLQAAVDAAALAAGREANKSKAELEQIAQGYFNSNYGNPANSGAPSMELSIDGSSLTVRGSVTVRNYLTPVAGFENTTISASSEVSKEATGLEVILVFDNTGSMGSQSRLSTLKVAAHDFVEILFGPREVADTLKIGVVPFSQFVNVGADKANENWIDASGANPYSRDNFLSSSWHNWRAWTSIQNRSWTGCVESRAGAMSVNDTLPDPGNPNTLFPPAFAPDEPGDSNSRTYFYENGQRNYFYNSYLKDRQRNSDNLDKRQRRETKYNNARVYTNSRGPSEGCNIQAIQELTNVKSPVLTTINNMKASGYTHVAEGVGWGLRVISPNPPFTEGVDYSDEEITKAMVLLTDGENTFNSESNRNESTYTAYGFLNQARLGSSNYWTAISAQNALLAQACNHVRAAEITTYAFAYNVPSATQRNLIKNCATDPEKYFDPPSNAALVQNFQQIADELRKLHLSK